MRQGRFIIGLLVTAGTLAVSAAPALAEGFESSGGETKGVGLGAQTFKFGEAKSIKITCEKTKTSGTATAGTQLTLTDIVKPGKCSYLGKGVKFEPIEFAYSNPAAPAEGNNVAIVKPVAINVSALKCTITIDAQKLPSEEFAKKFAATFSTELFKKKNKKFEEMFPTGEKKLIISNAFKGVEWETEAIKEGKGLCAELGEPSGENGEIKGELRDEVKGGTLAPIA